MTPIYEDPEKRIALTWGWLLSPAQSCISLIGLKLNFRNHRVSCMQNDRLGHTVSSQKTIIQTDPRSRRYWQKSGGLVCIAPNQNIMANTSCQGGPFELLFFCVETVCPSWFFCIQATLRFRKFNFHPIRGLGWPRPNFSVTMLG
jgi:hypothetical protein